jgi:hypothetical protein
MLRRSDKILAYLTLISGLVISAVAVWYSVAGLVAIFAAAALPIMIMGVALETSKLVATVWLKWNWDRAPFHIKTYLISAISILMIITSLGIFGFLSKAHLDQTIPTGDVAAKVSLIDEKIQNERNNIDDARRLLKQLDDAVIGIQGGEGREIRLRDGTTKIENPAERALQVRRSQANDRANLTKIIEESQSKIVQLQEEKAPFATELRKVEAEVGPIKYIAALIYGNDADYNTLESAVRWVIIIIVLVFDPLAVVLLLASQYSFQWIRQQEEERKNELVQETSPSEDSREETSTTQQSDGRTVDEGSGREQSEDTAVEERDPADEANEKIAEIEKEVDIDQTLESIKETERSALDEWNEMIAEAEKAAEIEDENSILEKASESEKEAMKRWKADYPDSSLKFQRLLLSQGSIDRLPWENYLKPVADFSDDEAAQEAAKWAIEQLEKNTEMTYIDKEGKDQIVKSVNYQQNAEQGSGTIWNRIKDQKRDGA